MQREMPVPRYYQIFHQLEKSIQENTYAPGDKLPSEKELQLTFDVSRITARRALEEMERNGFVTRRQGKGTYVAKQPEGPKLAKFTGSIDQLFMVGQAAAVTEADVEQMPAPHKVKIALKLDGSDTSVTRIRRVLSLGGKPHTFHQNFYLQAIGKKIERQDVSAYPLLELVERIIGKPIIEVRQVVEATVADSDLANRLAVSFGSPLLYFERTIFAERGTPIGFAQAYYRGDSYRMSVTLVRKGKSSSKGWHPPS